MTPGPPRTPPLQRLSLLALALFGLGAADAPAPAATAGAADAARVPAYSYEASHLILRLPLERAEKLSVELCAVEKSGEPQRRATSEAFDGQPGDNRLVLPVAAAASGHRVRYMVAGEPRRLWPNRGIWYSGSKELRPVERPPLAAAKDIVLASGASVRADAGGDSHLELGRTLGLEGGLGVRLDGEPLALVFVAQGTPGAVTVTLTERRDGARLQYWDYLLSIGAKARRYVIPLAHFRPRLEGGPGAPTSLQSVAFRAALPAAKGDELTVAHLALTDEAPRLRKAARAGSALEVTVGGGARVSGLEYFLEEGPRQVRSVDGNLAGTTRLAPPPTRYWLCYHEADATPVCDPPDAPTTSYSTPPAAGEPLVVDTFDGTTPVNAYRLPTTAFSSLAGVDPGRFSRRGKSVLQLWRSGDENYVGYSSPLPEPLGAPLETVVVQLRGQVPSAAVFVGLRDPSGREPKLCLGDYLPQLGESWQRVRLPLEAFRALRGASGAASGQFSPAAITVTLTDAGTQAGQKLELAELALFPELTPLLILSFDGVSRTATALGGHIHDETSRGARLALDHTAPGQKGRGLGVTVGGVGNRAYASLVLGLGATDARRYGALRFWVRGKAGGESVAVYLVDGQKRRKVELREELKVTPAWQEVKIPLARFGAQLDLHQLRQLVFAWEDRDIKEETLYLDELAFE